GHKTKKPDEPEQDLALELADVLFVLIAIANEQKIDLQAAFEQVLEKYRTRDADRWTPKACAPKRNRRSWSSEAKPGSRDQHRVGTRARLRSASGVLPEVPCGDGRRVRDRALADESVDVLLRHQPHLDRLTCVLAALAIRRAPLQPDHVHATRLDRRVHLGDADHSTTLGAIAGLLLQLAHCTRHRILALVQHAGRELERHATHAVTVLFDQDEPAVRRVCDGLDAVRPLDHVEVLYAAVPRRAGRLTADGECTELADH